MARARAGARARGAVLAGALAALAVVARTRGQAGQFFGAQTDWDTPPTVRSRSRSPTPLLLLLLLEEETPPFPDTHTSASRAQACRTSGSGGSARSRSGTQRRPACTAPPSIRAAASSGSGDTTRPARSPAGTGAVGGKLLGLACTQGGELVEDRRAPVEGAEGPGPPTRSRPGPTCSKPP